jgi:agmatine deiminase
MGLLIKFRKSVLGILCNAGLSRFHRRRSDDQVDFQQGQFVFPAESEPHEATILGFPSRCSLPPEQYDAVCRELAELAAAITEFEPVRIYVRPEDTPWAETLFKESIRDASRVTLIRCPVNHCWVRDTGPVYVHEATGTHPKRRFALSLRFNEWGDKKPESNGKRWGQQWPLMDDKTLQENTEFARWVIEHDRSPSSVTCINAPIRLEGGALVTDGDGTLLITESSIICEARNPGMSKSQIEVELKRLLGVEKVIWFPGRRNMDITDAHMDAEARFVRPGVIVTTRPHEGEINAWNEMSAEIHEILDRETDARGRRMEIHSIDEPDPRGLVKSPEDELITSYVNFVFVNGGLIIPKYGDELKDQQALQTLQALMPERAIRQVYTNAIPLTGGVLHCVTQQVPVAK